MTRLQIQNPIRYTHIELFAKARRALADADGTTDPCERFALAHLAALRAAGAVVSAYAYRLLLLPRCPDSVWNMFAAVSPGMKDWSDHFAANARLRVQAEAGTAPITPGEADAHLGQAQMFVTLVAGALALGGHR